MNLSNLLLDFVEALVLLDELVVGFSNPMSMVAMSLLNGFNSLGK